MIHLDTSALVGALSGNPGCACHESAAERSLRLGVSTLVLFEWWRGPRLEGELAYQELLFPREEAVPFGTREALLAADIYRRLGRPRQRSIDIAIAACALAQEASLSTLNTTDFKDIPGLQLI